MDIKTKTQRRTRQLFQREGEKSLSEILLAQLIFAALGALVGSAELLFGVRPFGIALAAAATEFFPAAALGAALFSVLTRDFISLVAVAVVAAVRVALAFLLPPRERGDELFSERILYRIALATLVIFGTGLFRIIRGGFRYYDLFGLLLALVATALAALLFAGIFEEKDKLFLYSREAGLAALILTSIFAMRTVAFFGIYPSAVAAAGIAFLLVSHRGALWGAAGGILAGLCFHWQLSPAFFLAAIGFSLLQKSSRGGGIIAGCAAGAAYAFLILRADGITLLLPSLLTAGALFLAGDSAGLVEGSVGKRARFFRRRAAEQSAKARSSSSQRTRLNDISCALLDLSGTFFELSSKLRRPGVMDLRHLCDKAFDNVCPSCRNRDICWGSEYQETACAVGALGSRLHSTGAVDKDQLPAGLAARCSRLSDILEEINQGAARMAEVALRGDRTSVVASDYAVIGRVLKEAVEESEEAFATDHAAGERIVERLERLGYSLESAAVCGKSRRSVILRGVRLPGRHLKIRDLRRVLEQHCHFPLGTPEVSESEGVSDIVFHERERFASLTVKETRAKGRADGRYCGDSVTTLSSAKGFDYALLCDGMGSGTAAALTSALSTTFLSRMLQGGMRADTALRMLNAFLSARGTRENESSTTVDLLEIDRVSGEASLFKCGAAPTFLLRRGEVTRFFSHTAPVGILESLDAERTVFSLRAGDVILQVSDGITQGEEDCPWLAELLRTRWDGDAEAFARTVLARAHGEGADDLSVMITQISTARSPAEEADAQHSA